MTAMHPSSPPYPFAMTASASLMNLFVSFSTVRTDPPPPGLGWLASGARGGAEEKRVGRACVRWPGAQMTTHAGVLRPRSRSPARLRTSRVPVLTALVLVEDVVLG
ncbi:hypothetical protein DFH07DRAFT_221571 [Mycena maculata]|uniref:Uncharacterized protein n=1 Tax=Mycena maculata TaxID=230809 RepID=A0AAD7HUI2_9AGAR|nr:hypothetical protein DFH07DRAFT_221571 [Mycena maculata]